MWCPGRGTPSPPSPSLRLKNNVLTSKDLLEGFGQIPFRDDDLLMVHSGYNSFGGVEGGAEAVVNAVNELVIPTKQGNTFWPAYTVDAWCNDHYFNIDETPGEMGVIPEVARLMDGARRTRHPIHSFTIHGPWKHAFQFDNIESFEKRGPFGHFHDNDGLVISVGVPWNDTISFVHYVENQVLAAYRKKIHFAGLYVDGWGEAKVKSFRMSARKTKKHIMNVAPLYDQVLVPDGVVKQFTVGQAIVSWFRCQEYYDAVAPLVLERPELFHYVEEWKPKPAYVSGYYPDGEPLDDDWNGEGHA